MSDSNHPAADSGEPIQAELVEGRRLSFIWIVPLVAALVAGWLIWQGLATNGERFEIVFDSADGIEAGQTRIVYRGVAIGLVEDIHLDPDLDKVVVTAELRPDAGVALTTGTRFWLVRPRFSLSGVSGLETLIQGQYIGVEPGHGEPAQRFVAEDRPALAGVRDGLRLSLTANELGSVGEGSAIYFREIPVGKVLGHHLSDSGDKVVIDIHIEEKYRHLVNQQSRFWNASGLTVSGGISGLSVEMASLEALLIGGIAFDTPAAASGPPLPAANGDRFVLHSNFESAEIGVEVTIRFDTGAGLEPGQTRVRMNGIDVGVVKNLRHRPDLSWVLAEVYFDPRFESLLNTGTRFWMVRPEFSFEGVTGLDTVLGGRYVAGLAGNGVPTRRFIALKDPPGTPNDAPGLHLNLSTDRVGGLRAGAPITYRDIEIGQVANIRLQDDGETVLIRVHIESDYAPLVKTETRFWRRAAVDFSGGPAGVGVRLANVRTLLSGGIEMASPEVAGESLLDGNGSYPLYDSYPQANHDAALTNARDGALSIVLNSRQVRLARGAPVYHRGVQVGVVERSYLQRGGDDVITDLRIDAAHAGRVRRNSRFWQRSALDVDADLSGVQLRTAPLGMMLFGGVEFDVPEGLAGGKAAASGSRYRLYDSADAAQQAGKARKQMRLKLLAQKQGGLQQGSPILFNGVTIGQLREITLRDGGTDLLLEAEIDARYGHLLNAEARFWHASGIRVDAGLAGIEVELESAKALLVGALRLGHLQDARMPAKRDDRYVIYPDREAAERGRLAVKLLLADAQGLRAGADVRLHGVSVGRVAQLQVLDDYVLARLALEGVAAGALTSGSELQVVSAEIGITGVREPATLVTGPYVRILPGVGKPKRLFDLRGQGRERGLPLRLEAARLGSVKVGNKLYYRQIPVGRVTAVSLGELADRVVIDVLIEPRYTALVRQNSLFWNASGIEFDIGLVQGVKIDTQSLESLLAGGIAFATPGGADGDGDDLFPGETVAPGTTFRLYEKAQPEWLDWDPPIPFGDLAKRLIR